ncbi:MAG: Bax inhibitor-1 family protein [Verrucomicrobiota bacterium]
MNQYPNHVYSLADAAPDTRAQFIRRTYAHLALAVLAFVGLEAFLLQLDISRELSSKVLSAQYGWLMVLGAFMIVSWLARGMASKSDSQAVQYAGLALYVVAQAIIFVPMLLLAQYYAQDGGTNIIAQAGIITGLLFAGLTATVFITRKDFSFLGSIVTIGFFIALGLIVAGVIFGFNMGLWFSGAMVLLAAGAILYDT